MQLYFTHLPKLSKTFIYINALPPLKFKEVENIAHWIDPKGKGNGLPERTLWF